MVDVEAIAQWLETGGYVYKRLARQVRAATVAPIETRPEDETTDM